MIDLCVFNDSLAFAKEAGWHHALLAALEKRLQGKAHGDWHRWSEAVKALPQLSVADVDLNQAAVTIKGASPLQPNQHEVLRQSLAALCPWRKGPYQLFEHYIDTEWRSDWKWQRIAPYIQPLTDRVVLDVGCGSGYHMWRMLGAGAKRVMGIDPSLLFLCQFMAVKYYAGLLPIHFLPLTLEDFPQQLGLFDTVFSMGVLYHRKSPCQHLQQLHHMLRPEGELVLETLIIEDEKQGMLVPNGRYAQMRNVWCLPSIERLLSWLEQVGFKQIRVVDINRTQITEQRRTDWMPFQSLADFLDPNDSSRTIEGYPAPVRATLCASA